MESRRREVVFVRLSSEEVLLLDQLVAHLAAALPFWRISRPDAIRAAIRKMQAGLPPEPKNSK